MDHRSKTFRACVLATLLWVVLLTAARDLLHNHDGLTEQANCPACRVERVTGTTTPAVAALVVIPILVLLGAVPRRTGDGYVPADLTRGCPPRSPPIPA